MILHRYYHTLYKLINRFIIVKYISSNELTCYQSYKLTIYNNINNNGTFTKHI